MCAQAVDRYKLEKYLTPLPNELLGVYLDRTHCYYEIPPEEKERKEMHFLKYNWNAADYQFRPRICLLSYCQKAYTCLEGFADTAI